MLFRSVSTPRPSPAPAPAPVVPPAPVAPPPPSVDPDAPILRAVKFNLSGGTGLKVICGSAVQTAESSVLFRDLRAGPCVVSSGGLSTTVTASEPRGFSCVTDGVKLECH